MADQSNIPTLSELQDLLPYLSEADKNEIDKLISDFLWLPLPGPQTEALESEADILFYGGAAGGGKTDLLLGAALTGHSKSIIFRREGTQLHGIYDRLGEILGNRDGFNSQSRIWRLASGQIEFGSAQHLGDEQAYQGRPHDLIGFDEITHFNESQFRFLMGWLRTTKKGQRCRVICTGNPPTDSDGLWVKEFWGPWLDKDHPNPAKPGELRWYAVINGKDTEVSGPEVIRKDGRYIKPKSRTFIPSKVQDNPFLMETDYESTLQALPEPLRSQMLDGDFTAGTEDDPWQIIPTKWVEDAMTRWSIKGREGEMDSMGVDPARGGRDETIIAHRYGNWFGELDCYPGAETPNGPVVAALILTHRRDMAPVHLDVIGIGSSVYDHLVGNGIQTIPVNNAESTKSTDKSGKLRFANRRAETWWQMRECLDPRNQLDMALPLDRKLKGDLTAPRWKLTQRGIQVEDKEELKKRIGRSPDRGDAVVLANMATMKDHVVEEEENAFDRRQGRNETTGY